MRIDPIKFILENSDALHALLDLIPLPMYIKEVNGNYLTCNQAFELETGLSYAQIVGKNVFEVWPKQQAEIFDAQDKILYENHNTQDVQLEVDTLAGKHHVVQFHKKIFYDKNQKPAGYLCILFDITEKKLLENLLHTQALTDELTQLPNRRAGLARLAQILSESSRKKNALCVALLDIDYFKNINDTYGHASGDKALITIANVLKSSLREYDICARYGGEEFLICLPNTKIAQALDTLERVRLACEASQTLFNDQQSFRLTVSIGVAQFPAQGRDAESLLEASDSALYRAKEGGRNRVVNIVTPVG